MTTADNVLHCVEKAEESKQEVSSLVKEFVMNASYPLEERWKVYTETPHYYFGRSDHVPQVYGLLNVKEVVDRYFSEKETVDNVQLYQMYTLSNAKENVLLKEAMMQSGIRRWKFNW